MDKDEADLIEMCRAFQSLVAATKKAGHSYISSLTSGYSAISGWLTKSPNWMVDSNRVVQS